MKNEADAEMRDDEGRERRSVKPQRSRQNDATWTQQRPSLGLEAASIGQATRSCYPS